MSILSRKGGGKSQNSRLQDTVTRAAIPLRGQMDDYDALLQRIGDASIVLLGEATHGTHEFYRTRAEITQRLIVEKDFHAVAVEADWPDACRVARFVRHTGNDGDARAALSDFRRFPTWMWRNEDVLHFVGWLRQYNEGRKYDRQVGFYGLDLYSLYSSIAAVVGYLEQVDPEAARRAKLRYACFDHHEDGDAQQYGHGVQFGVRQSCEDEAVAQLVELQRKAADLLRRDGMAAEDEQFFAERNAEVVKNAEAYYREMFRGRINTWNLRDRHMTETLAALRRHLGRHAVPAKIVVWEHNSHIGDARATEMSDRKEWNVGQLVREQHGGEAVLVGFTTHSGTVTAASNWDAPAERKRVRPALPESIEAAFHNTQLDRFLLVLDDPSLEVLREPRLQRMIGVIYRPESERWSHYFHCRLAEQFDAVLHFDATRAVEPLDRSSSWRVEGAVPDTYPFGV